MAYNISESLGINRNLVLQHASYFYSKNVLLLLNLGPLRIIYFAKWLRNKYVCNVNDSPKARDILYFFKISENQLNEFIEQTFHLLFTKSGNLSQLNI